MTELWFEISENPAYRHILLNHLPITGLAVSACVLAWAIWENRWRSLVFGLLLCLATSASGILVMQSGDAAYPFLFDQLDGAGQAWLDDHVALAERWGRALPTNALLATIALGIGARRASLRRYASAVVLCTTLGSLAAASVIATAGGQVRHSEFRFSSAPTGEAIAVSSGETSQKTHEARGPAVMRRLTEAQYRNAIEDVFGPGIELAGRFEPENRRDGLIALGSSRATITSSGFEQYERMASDVARQALAPAQRAKWIPCAPLDEASADPACAASILERVGPMLLRVPLSESNVAARVEVANQAVAELGDFYAGIASALTSLLVAPGFLFRIEATGGAWPDAALASRLSYFLWNAGPDAELLEVVGRGGLADPATYAQQVDRLLSSPRLEQGVRALFEDVFQFDDFDDLGKDPIRYPIFSAKVASHAKEQTLRTVVDHLVERESDYRTLFTTRRSFMTRALGPVYALPVRAESGWEEIDFPESSGRRGVLTHASFNMLNAHSGRSSATLRGLFLREALLCQHVPPAPADVDFGLFNADDSPEFRTARDRLEVHSSNATCRSCHLLTDPIGLGLERFDGMGRHRSTENGAPIDASGDLDGDRFEDPAGLGEAIAASDRLTACLAKQTYQYAIGRVTTLGERSWLRELEERFEDGGYKLKVLLREIVHSPGFLNAPGLARAERVTSAPSLLRRSAKEDAS